MKTAAQAIGRKCQKLLKDPVGALRGRFKLEDHKTLYRLYRNSKKKLVSVGPVYDLCHWYVNRIPRKAYELEMAHMKLSAIQRRIVNELEENGISMVHFDDLFPDKSWKELQELTETLLHKPANQALIRAIENGGFSVDVSKYYLVHLLGRPPVFDHQDRFVEMSLSDRVLQITCAYLGMFSRLMDMDLWCNVPTEGPDHYSQRWHRDADDKITVRMFLYLRDVGPNSGPLYYIPGSHNGGPFSKVYPQTIDDSHYPPQGAVEKKFLPNQIKVCTGKAGTLVFCDTAGLHKGGHSKEGLRVVLQTAFTTNVGLIDPNNKNRYAIKGLRKESLAPAAQYAIGRLQSK